MKQLNLEEMKVALAFCATGVCCTDKEECPLYGEHVCSQSLSMNALKVIQDLQNQVKDLENLKNVKKEEAGRKVTKDQCIVFMENYNQYKGSYMPKVKYLNENRLKKTRRILENYNEDQVKDALLNLGKSDFLNGKNERKWAASFDWFIKEENFLKVLEDSYKEAKKDSLFAASLKRTEEKYFKSSFDADDFFEAALERTYKKYGV